MITTNHDDRGATRARTGIPGRAVLMRGASPVPCTVRDLSTTGARIELTNADEVGRLLDLYIKGDPRPYLARVRWCRDGVVGVHFLEQRAAPDVLPD
jgi:hypothetical protein